VPRRGARCPGRALAFAAQAALAQAATRLDQVELQPQPGEQLEVRLVLDGPAPQPVAFTIDNPARLAVDLPGTSVALESRRIDVKSGGVDTIVAAEASGRTRVVFNLDRMQPYSTRTAGNTVYVTLGRSVAVPPPAAPSRRRQRRRRPAPRGSDGDRKSISAAAPTVPAASSSAPRDPRVQASLKQEGGRIVVDFPRTTVSKDQARRYDVVDFATPVSSFDVAGTAAGARIVVAVAGDYEQLAYQTDRDYVLELRPEAEGRDGRCREEGIQGRAPDAQLPGHRDPCGAAAARRDERPEHRGQRHGAG
jgi:type IV pilus assembly protein PilQ